MTSSEEQQIDPERRASALRFIVCLGIVSLFADMTYEGAHSIIGPYLKDLGASALQVAFIAGFGEMLGASLRYFSGRFADKTRAYWLITFSGYAMNVIAVPALAFAQNWQTAAILVIAERTGKAMRGPARDVLLSGATEEIGHGWGFGLHSIMDQTGAVIGPLVMVAAVARAHHFGPAFLWLVFPAVGTLLALTMARVLNPDRLGKTKVAGTQVMPRVFWIYVAAAGLAGLWVRRFPAAGLSIPKCWAFYRDRDPFAVRGRYGRERIDRAVVWEDVRPLRSEYVGCWDLYIDHGTSARVPGRRLGCDCQRGLLGNGLGGTRRLPAFRRRDCGFHEQTRKRIRSFQRRLWGDVVPGKSDDGITLQALSGRRGRLRSPGAVRRRLNVFLSATRHSN